MANTKRTDQELVTAHIENLPADLAPAIAHLRQAILRAHPEIAEQIKWNSPAFYYTGEMKAFDAKEYKRDLIVMNLNRGKILLVLPTGQRLKDTSGLLEGKYTDGRRLITFKDLADIKKKEAALTAIINEWIDTVDR
ncbi:MAG: DUF1801 domain-containing protein [Bacteroidota bacterium]